MHLWCHHLHPSPAGRRATTSGSNGSDSPDSPLGRRRVQTTVRAELTSHQYKVRRSRINPSSSSAQLFKGSCHYRGVILMMHTTLSIPIFSLSPCLPHIHSIPPLTQIKSFVCMHGLEEILEIQLHILPVVLSTS